MSPVAVAHCPHELRPGTTVCLHCRRAARASGAARTRRALLRAGLVAVVVVCAAAASSGVSALQRYRAPAEPAPTPTAPSAPAAPAGPVSESLPAASLPAATLAPITPEGRTALRMGAAYAHRTGDIVTVYFDESTTRTRRAHKFEHIVRTTLPEVYGAVADSMLARIRVGALVQGRDLVTTLPVRGLRLPHTTGGALTLWPETRAGRDGPLVIAYRVTATP